MFTSAHQQSSAVEALDDEQMISTPENAQQNGIAQPSRVTGYTQAYNADTSITALPEDCIPVAVPIIKNKANRQGKTAVVTSSPYVKELTNQQENRELKEGSPAR